MGVAVIDSGVAGQLADFSTYSGPGGSVPAGTPPTSRVVETAVANPGASNATDPVGHGTMVAGIIAGNGLNLPRNDPNYGKYIGVAPNANLISIKVGDDQGNSNELAVIMGIQFAVQHQADQNIRVINLSLSASVPESYLTSPLDAAVEAAWRHGIVVVVSAGNGGNTPGAETTRRPTTPTRSPSARWTSMARPTSPTTPSPPTRASAPPRTALPSPSCTPPARTWSARWPPAACSPSCARSACAAASTCRPAAPRSLLQSYPARWPTCCRATPT